MYIYCKNWVCSFNHCYRGKAVGITYYECESVALVIHCAKHMFRVVICGMSGSTTFFDFIPYAALFSEKKLLYIKCVF